MIKAPVDLQDLRKKLYKKAKAEEAWRFWGLYVHICKRETLYTAYKLAKRNQGAPGIDGVTFAAIEANGVEAFLEQIRHELTTKVYRPLPNRICEIPKENGKIRRLGIASIRDRVVQGAIKLILEPIFEADFQAGSFGYRPKKTPAEALQRVRLAAMHKTKVIDIDLSCYFDTVRHDILLKKMAERVQDEQVLHLLKLILKVSGKRGVSQGGPLSPLFSNVYLNEIDKMLEMAKSVTQEGNYTRVEYARFADDLIVLVYGHPRYDKLVSAVEKRLHEEFAKIGVQVNLDKSKRVDLTRGESFSFLGFDFRRKHRRDGKPKVMIAPRMKARSSLLSKLKPLFHRGRSQSVPIVIATINPILRGWVNYFRIGNSSRCFNYVKDWVEKKVRRLLAKSRKRPGYGWNRWSKNNLYRDLGLFADL